jgi:capsular polysaccharide biosynthesis protein
MVILDPAYLPTHPARGGRTVIVLFGFFASFALGLGVALSRTLLDDRIHERVDLERLGVADVVCVVPRPAPAGLFARLLPNRKRNDG